MTNDEKHLNTLATCFTVFGWLVGIFMSFPLIHVTVGVLMVSGVIGDRGGQRETRDVHTDFRGGRVVQPYQEEASVPTGPAMETVYAEPDDPDDRDERVFQGVGWFFIVLGSMFVLLGWTCAIFMMVTAGKLRRRESRLFCCVMAGIACVSVPLGTVLGVFTLIVLMRPSVQALFAGLPSEMLAPPIPPVPPASPSSGV